MKSNIQNIERDHQPRIIYTAKFSFKYEREINAFPKLRKFTTRHALQEILKGALLLETRRQKDTKL